ncbi:hypothetical protein GIS00_20105 [Nakamurella sp. YIM 132087]|uniref:HTH cro/C1-type domain-containing protein n=1 Tax=Nakamurella alba TaxID=2665158 RepID=A0A7K1FQ27_9ACTN|nr:helix-turn-helix domain-containing protein [Nakamurella alba]MTD16246.1 hypothetical protein [Nakamurella alba]
MVDLPSAGPPADRAEMVRVLRERRERAGLSVRELAARVDAPLGTVGGYLSGRHLPTTAQLPLFRRILVQLGVPAQDQDAWLDLVGTLRRTSGPRITDAPYRGLLSFETGDAGWFFGRSALVDQLLRLATDRTDPRPLVVLGPTGSGKSSVLRAGLLAGWPGSRALITPGPDPFGPLAAARDVLAAGDGLVVIDQVEEIFVRLPDPEARQRWAAAVTDPASWPPGTRVVFGLRADFFVAAASVPALEALLHDRQVLVGPMGVENLRSAIVGPAARAGLAIDDDLVRVLLDDLLLPDGRVHVAGVLPLLSHVLLATWQRTGGSRLTLDAYRDTGGLESAVQQTAEQVWADLPGEDERRLARGLLLRMVHLEEHTADADRGLPEAVTRRRAPLPDEAEREVLEPFVAQRLVVIDDTGVSIAHESLLTAWPRLRGWVDEDRAGLLLRRRLHGISRQWQIDHDDSGLVRGARLEAYEEWLAGGDRAGELDRLELEYLDAARAAEADRRAARRRQVRLLRSAVAVAVVLAVAASVLAVVGFTARADAEAGRNEAAQSRDRAASREIAGYAADLLDSDPATAAQLAIAAYRISPTLEARSTLLDMTAMPIPTVWPGTTGNSYLALSPDGRTVAATDASTGGFRLIRTNPTADVRSAPVDPVGSAVLGAAAPPATGTVAVIFTLVWSPDGTLLVTGDEDGVVRVWDVRDLAVPVQLDEEQVFASGGAQAMVFTPDGSRLIIGGPAGTKATDKLPAMPGSPLRSYPVGRAGLGAAVDLIAPTIGPESLVQSLSMSADGMLAVGGADGTVSLRPDAGSGRPGPAVEPDPDASGSSQPVGALAFSPDGRMFAAGTRSGAVRQYEVGATGVLTDLPDNLPRFTSWVNALDYSADGAVLAIGSSTSEVRINRSSDGEQLATFGHRGAVTGVVFGPGDRSLLTVANDGSVRRYGWPGPVVGPFGATVTYLDYAPANTLLVGPAKAEGRVSAWDVADLQSPVEEFITDGAAVLSGVVAVDREGDLMAVGRADGQVALYTTTSTAAGPVAVLPTGADPEVVQQSMVFSPDGRTLFSGGDDQVVHVWDVSAPEAPRELSSLPGLAGSVYFLSLSSDGKLLVATIVADSGGGEIVWHVGDPGAPREVARIGDLPGYAFAGVFSPDGSTLAVTGTDRTVHLYGVSAPGVDGAVVVTPTGQLFGPTDMLIWLAFSPDGTRLAAAGNDGAVWMWDLTDPVSPRLIARLQAADSALKAVEFAPDGRSLAAGGVDRRAHLWLSDAESAATWICGSVGVRISEQQWSELLPEQKFAAPCP